MARKTVKPIQVDEKNRRRVASFTCFECGQKKPAKDFYLNANNPLGICSICIECCFNMCVNIDYIAKSLMATHVRF